MPLSPLHVASSSIAATATTGIEKDEKATADSGAEWKTGNWCWEEPLPDDSDRCTVASGDSPPSAVKSEQGERNEPVAKSERSETVPKSERNEPVPKTEADPPPIKAENVRSTGSPDSVPSSSLSSPPLAQDSGVKAETKQPLERPKKQEDPGASSLQLPTPPPQGPEVKPEVKTESHHASPKMEDEQGDTAHENWAPGCFCWLPDASDLDVPEKRKRKRVPVEDDDAEARDVDAPEEKDCVSSSTAAMSKKNTEGSNKKSRRLPPRFPQAAALGCYRDDDESNCDIWSDGDATFDDIVSESDDESQGSILDANGTIRDAKWEKMYQYLVEFKQKHGTTQVPKGYKADPKLARWIKTQRTLCKRKDRIDRLNEIGFVWKVLSSYGFDDESWETMYQRLVEYKQKHGTTQVPQEYKEHPKLGKWVMRQRAVCKRKDRIDRLNEIGFVWSIRDSSGCDDESWETMYHCLLEYKQTHGTTQVPYHYEKNPKLGKWVMTQRRYCKRKDRIDRLNEIGFVWRVLSSSGYDDESWETMYQRLVECKQKHGTTQVPRKYKEDQKLASWVMTQRSSCKRKDRIDRLNEIGFVWRIKSPSWSDDESWETMYQRLVEYKQKHGTTQVSKGYKEDPKLATWVQTQRSRCRRKDRIDRLNRIGFLWKVEPARNTNLPDVLQSSLPPPEGPENQTQVKTGTHEASEFSKRVEEPSVSSLLSLSPAQGPEMKPEAKAKSRKDEDDLCAEESTDWTPGCFCWLPDLAASDLEAPERVKRKRVQGNDDDDDEEENAMDDNKEDVHSTEDNKDRPRFSGSRHCYFRCDDQSNSHFSDDDASCWEIDSESDNDSQISTFETNNCRRSGNERHDHPPNSIRFQSRPCQKEWGATGESKWEIMYQRLTEYKQKNGSTRVPHLCKADPQLADWKIQNLVHGYKHSGLFAKGRTVLTA
ncbi:unnamed protein product [Pseudo-nitzschia multistriata]|uniref:Helicase-associated domain-containing protein n=1 Tax=Pseudo-nitzschia multistriata TaxID=183589 RepID=A0A448Z063_9STRA|nr:unnamed protein product [Pseudo-nitzschia multistriata]